MTTDEERGRRLEEMTMRIISETDTPPEKIVEHDLLVAHTRLVAIMMTADSVSEEVPEPLWDEIFMVEDEKRRNYGTARRKTLAMADALYARLEGYFADQVSA